MKHRLCPTFLTDISLRVWALPNCRGSSPCSPAFIQQVTLSLCASVSSSVRWEDSHVSAALHSNSACHTDEFYCKMLNELRAPLTPQPLWLSRSRHPKWLSKAPGNPFLMPTHFELSSRRLRALPGPPPSAAFL